MKITRLDLTAFGPFTDVSLELGAGAEGVHVLFGPNEAGKSSTLRAIAAWFFGFDHETPDKFLHAYDRLAVGGTLRLASGEELRTRRRKGNKNTLLDAVTGAPIDAEAWSRCFGGVDEALYRSLYAIDHETLVTGAKTLLDAKGETGRLLFGAAVGSPRQLRLVEALSAEADQRFRAHAPKTSIAASLLELERVRKRERDATHSVGQLSACRAELADAERALSRVEAETREASARLGRLTRVERVARALLEREALLDERAREGEVRLLRRDFDALVAGARSRREALGLREEGATRAIDEIRAELAALEVRADLLENAGVIQALERALGAAEKARLDQPRQLKALQTHTARVSELLRELRPDLAIEEVDTLRAVIGRSGLIEELAQRGLVLDDRLAKLDERERKQADERDALARSLGDEGGAPPELDALGRALAAARAEGAIDRAIDDERVALEHDRRRLEAERARLGRFTGSLDALVALRLPELAAIDRFAARFDALADREEGLRREARELERGRADDERRLEALLESGEIPSFAALERARADREARWIELRDWLLGDEGALRAEPLAGRSRRVVEYGEAVARADQLSDALARDAARVEERSALGVRLEGARRRMEALAASAREHADERGELERAWAAEWVEALTPLGAPREMREWREAAMRLREGVERLARAELAHEERRRRRGAHVDALAAALGVTAAAQAGERDALAPWLARAEARLEAAQAAIREREARHARLRDVEQRIVDTKDEVRRETLASARWRDEWARAIADLGVDPADSRRLALRALEKLDELFKHHDAASEARLRVEGMAKVVDGFAERARALAARLGPLGVAEDPEEIAEELRDRLARARSDEELRKRLVTELEKRARELALARRAIEEIGAEFAALRGEAAVERDDELDAAAEASGRARARLEALEALERQLRDSGEGRSIEELRAELDLVDRDRLPADVEAIRLRLTELASERDAARDRVREVAAREAAMEGSFAAVEAAADREAVLARLAPEIERYLTLSFARRILKAEMERYRRAHQTPILERAGVLFERLTLGSFIGLRDDVAKDGTPILLGERVNGASLGVEAMSEGTRDQLYLALRLATLEESRPVEPIPLIADDVLIAFDDERARAGLEVLAELSRTTQVLLLTHHARIAALARELGEAKGLFVHELPANASVGDRRP